MIARGAHPGDDRRDSPWRQESSNDTTEIFVFV
jgi:hypothetical protein